VTFYRPEGKRTKIFTEGKAFPSDQVSFLDSEGGTRREGGSRESSSSSFGSQYAVQSHLDLHGLGSESSIALDPREGEGTLRTEDILKVIEEQGEEVRSSRSLFFSMSEAHERFPSSFFFPGSVDCPRLVLRSAVL